jgi:penicillin-binding protein 2
MNQRTRLSIFVVQALIISLMAALLGRLFYLQVAAGDRYKAAALDIQSRDIVVPAIRGLIVDADGVPLAMNRVGLAVTVDRTIIDKQSDKGLAIIKKVSKILELNPNDVWRRTRLCGELTSGDKSGCWIGNRFQPIPITKDADPNVALQIVERSSEFPGIDAKPTAVRYYPGTMGATGAHVLGYVGALTDDDLAKDGGTRYYRSESIGKDGLEFVYDQYLRGRPGIKTVIVDRKESVTEKSRDTAPSPGANLVTSLDVRIQGAAEEGLATAVRSSRAQGYRADGGAAIVMDVKTGRVLALASYPTYDPNIWEKGLTVAQAKSMFSEQTYVPALSRPIQGLFAPASTFKAFSIFAAADAGYDLNATYDCPGVYKVGNREFTNYESKALGRISLKTGISASCDTLWYKIAYSEWLKDGGLSPKNPNDRFFNVAHEFQLEQRTQIDLPSEAFGRVPDRQWRLDYWKENKDFYCNYQKRAAKKDLTPFLIQLAKENCIDGGVLRAGDAVNFSIGQGDTVITPLKLTQAYAAIANGGTLWQPLVAKAIVDNKNKVLKTFTPKVLGKVNAEPKVFKWLVDALHQVTIDGTAAGAFAGFPVEVAGKTGTAEVFGLNLNGTKKDSTSWFASFAPVKNPRYAVVVMVSQGGTGAAAAGVGARQIYDSIFGVVGGRQVPEKIVYPSGPPTKLPKISATTKVMVPKPTASPSASATQSGNKTEKKKVNQ